MNKKFTLNDIETFLDCRFGANWINRTVMDYRVRGYKKACINDFDGSIFKFKLSIKGKEIYQDLLVSDESFIWYNTACQKDVSKDWKKFRSITVEL